jgi:predicted ATPase
MLYERIKYTPSLSPGATARLTNLPHPLTRFIGREHDVAEIKSLLLGKDEPEAAARLVTLTGPGGCGKTRLAIEVAHRVVDRFDDGVWWVELAPVADPAFVTQAVAKVLGLSDGTSQPLSETLINHLRPKHLLLVLDNCEHLIIACAQLTEALLHTVPHLLILTTSREGLGISGERLWPVPSLSVPDPHQPLSLD